MRVSTRTLHNWEAGRVRIPYAAYKLIRILRGYELPGHAWKGYRLIGDTLWSPENLPFHAADARWWSLTVQMAHEYRRQSKARQAQRSAENGARAKVENVSDALALANIDGSLLALSQGPAASPTYAPQYTSASWLPMINKVVTPFSKAQEIAETAKNEPLSSMLWGHNGAASLDILNRMALIWGHETNQANPRKVQPEAASAFTDSLSSSSGEHGPVAQCVLSDRFIGLYREASQSISSAQTATFDTGSGDKSVSQGRSKRPLPVRQWKKGKGVSSSVGHLTLSEGRGFDGLTRLARQSVDTGGAL